MDFEAPVPETGYHAQDTARQLELNMDRDGSVFEWAGMESKGELASESEFCFVACSVFSLVKSGVLIS